MVNEQVLRGSWNEVRGKIKEKWGVLTDDDLLLAQGDADQVIGVIQRRTGESREKIEHDLEGIAGQFGGTFAQVKDRAASAAATAGAKAKGYAKAAGEYAGAYTDAAGQQVRQAGQAAGDKYDELAARARAGYADAGQELRRHPLESVTVAFGTGLIAGVVLGLCFRPER